MRVKTKSVQGFGFVSPVEGIDQEGRTHVRKISKVRRKVKKKSQEELASRVIAEESLLGLAMSEYAGRVLHEAVERVTSTMRGAQAWGTEAGFVRSGLHKIAIERPRIRVDGQEFVLDEYKKMQSPTEFTEATRRAVMGGLATRSFERVGRALGANTGLSKTTVSGVSKSFAKDFEKLMEQDLGDIVAVMIDAIYFTDDLCVVATLGVNRFGAKRLCGLWAGSTESAELMKTVMTDMRNRNLNPKLFVIDGSKALKSAIDRHYDWVPVQRCQAHKRRNILAHVGEKNEAWASLQMAKIFKAETAEIAMALGRAFAADLAKINETAARSWLEAFPESITVLQFKDKELRRVLATTNAIESIFSSIRLITGRVKRWRNANHALYWTSGGYFRIQPNLRKIRGFRAIKELDGIGKLGEEQKQQKAA